MKTAPRIGTLHATQMPTDEATSGFHLHWPVDVRFGRGALGQLPTAMATRPERRILVVTSPSFAARSDLLDTIAGRLRDRETLVFDLVGSHPNIAQIQAAIDFARTRQVEAVIGLGGGSVLDTAKAVALLTRAGCDVRSYLLEEPDPAPAPLFTILIPTTAGSGSEVTRWATIWDTDNKRKHSLVLHSLAPWAAIVDPELTLTLPPRQTAISGADALAHALEAYWSRNVNPASEALAMAAVHRIIEHLIGAYQDPLDLEHRTEMLLGSLLAGLAFSQTETAAAHAISYPLTSHFGIPHGQATGI
ncbi:MAG: iron-containing alcohol dehydrogenase, partial [Candidatus Methylomirabilales bacterium]